MDRVVVGRSLVDEHPDALAVGVEKEVPGALEQLARNGRAVVDALNGREPRSLAHQRHGRDRRP